MSDPAVDPGESSRLRSRWFLPHLRLPRVLSAAFQLTWDAAPRQLCITLAAQGASAAIAGLQLLVARDVIAALLADGGARPTRLLELLTYASILTLLGAALGAVQKHQQQVLMAMVEAHTNARMLDRLAAVELMRFETPAFQDLLRRAQNALFPMQAVSRAAVNLASGVLLVTGIAIALAALQPVLLFLSGLSVIPVAVAASAGSRLVYQWWRAGTADERRRSYIFGLFSQRDYAKEIRAFGLAQHLRGAYEALSVRRLSELQANLGLRARHETVASVSTGMGMILGSVVLAYLVLDRRVTPAEAGAAVVASQQLNSRLGTIVQSAAQLYESSLFVRDWDQFSALAPSHAGSNRAAAPAREVVVDGVTFRYPDGDAGAPALDDVSMEVRAGEVVALVGRNGSGKTTLAKVLAGLYTPTRGRVLWDGEDPAGREPDLVTPRTAVVFQDFARFMLTVRENIGFGRAERIHEHAAIESASRRAGADAFIREWTAGYDTMLGPVFADGRDASIGQWQRIALARAFFREAALLILDEPTAALDAIAERDLFARLRPLPAGSAVVIISHRFSSVRNADRIYVLDRGRIVESGTHAELMRLRGHYEDLFTIQSSAYV